MSAASKAVEEVEVTARPSSQMLKRVQKELAEAERPLLATHEGELFELLAVVEEEAASTQSLAKSTQKIEGSSRLKVRSVYRIDKKTGERYRIVRPLNDERACNHWAPKQYEEIRKMTSDIDAIANNTGLPKNKIQRIKNHLFYDEHILRDGKGLFNSDPEIAAAWDRLIHGDFIENDLKLLEHEFFESRFEKIFKTDYSTAHEATINSGRDWEAPKFE